MLEDCVLNEPKQLVLTVTPTKNDKGGFTADVQELEHYDEGASDEAGEETPPEKPPKKVPRGDAGPSDHVLMIGVGKMKPKAY